MCGYSLCPLISLCSNLYAIVSEWDCKQEWWLECWSTSAIVRREREYGNGYMGLELGLVSQYNRLCVRLIYLIIALLKLLSLHIFYFPAYFIAWCYCVVFCVCMFFWYASVWFFLLYSHALLLISLDFCAHGPFLCAWLSIWKGIFFGKYTFRSDSLPLSTSPLSLSFSVSVRLFAVVFFYHYYYFAVAFIKSRYKWWNGIYTEIITLGRGMKCKSEN